MNARKISLILLCALLILLQCGCTPAAPQLTDPTAPSDQSTQAIQTDPTKAENDQQEPTATQPTQTESTETLPTETSPPQTFPIETEPQDTKGAETLIGAMYTRGELLALNHELVNYGPGVAKNGNRAPYADGAQQQYGDYGARFIFEDEPVIYLTFDCGYEYKNNTAAILDVLKEKDVKAVFFITGNYARKNEALIQRMINEGHVLASHSTLHRDMTTLTIEEMVDEIMGVHDYVLTHYGYRMYLFRPPEGHFSVRSLAVTQSLGYTTVLWTVAYSDWDIENQPDPRQALEINLNRAHNGAIYLLHGISKTNAAILGQLIDSLRSEGYTLQPIPQF